MTVEAAILPWQRPFTVVKVGGSLYDWSELARQLIGYLEGLCGENPLLIPGGGATADAIRAFDQTHRLGGEKAHWLALAALALNARFLQTLVPHSQVVEGLNAARACRRRGVVPILDVLRFARGDESRRDPLPHCWDSTSDSMAARVAIVANASRLVLLKSTAIPQAPDWPAAAAAGHVDRLFPQVVANATFRIEAVQLRTSPAGRSAPRPD